MTVYREGMEPMPFPMRARPVERGYPVPWFVAKVDGAYDFRIVGPGKLEAAIQQGLCWLCGQPLGATLAFVIGPMCAINRTTSEPPSHPYCAEWAIRACPFLSQQQKRRNPVNLPAGYQPPAGDMIERQAGVSLIWYTPRRYGLFDDGRGGVLIKVGDPIRVGWYCEARPATRAEIIASIEGGLPILVEMAEQDGPDAIAELERRRLAAWRLLPEE